MQGRILGALFALAVSSFPFGCSANAAVLSFAATARVTKIISEENGYLPFATPGVAIGDLVTFSAIIDTATAINRPWFDADPAVNVYDHAIRSASIGINSFSYFGTPDPASSGVQIWNNDIVLGTDVWSLFSDDFTNLSSFGAFGVGPGAIGQTFSFTFIDLSGRMTGSENIDDLPDLQYAGYTTFGFGLGDRSRNGGRSVYIQGDVVSATLARVASVPEPGSWLLMTLSFGIIGTGLRARRSAGVPPWPLVGRGCREHPGFR